MDSTMAYNPFLVPRAMDYGMGHLLTPPQYIPAFSLQHHGLNASLLAKHQQSLGRMPHPAGDMLTHPDHFRMRGLEPPEVDVRDDPGAELDCESLWEQFHEIGTEMVITKSGR